MTDSTNEQEKGLTRRVDELRTTLLARDQQGLARNTGALYEKGRFMLDLWGTAVSLSDNDFVAYFGADERICDDLSQAMLAYYFITSDGTPPVGNWISFRELPDGQFYASAFQGYTGNRLAQEFGNDIEAFTDAAERTAGKPLEFGDASFAFRALPNVPVAVVCWLGDDEFPGSCNLLFDMSIANHLPTDACAILGSMLTGKLVKALHSAPDLK